MKKRMILGLAAGFFAFGGMMSVVAEEAAADDVALRAALKPASVDQLAESLFERMDALANIMTEITDVESARKAKPQLEKIGKEMKILQEFADAMEKELTDEQKEALEEKYAPRIEAIMGKMFPAMMRIGQDEAIQKELEDIDVFN